MSADPSARPAFAIGPYRFDNPVWLAPMAGITDKPFRNLVRQLGAGHAISEMTSSNPALTSTRKSTWRMDHSGEPTPVHVQIAGSDPEQIARAAQLNVDRGADIIDINMGCPAKKVCSKLAGSSLLKDEYLVQAILEAVTDAVDVPVTLKTRTGWSRENKNAVRVARIAERAGIACLTLHGRTRNDFYKGDAEFDTLKQVRDAVSIPLIANGDIASTERAAEVLQYTGADAVMIGRKAQEMPWLPGQIAAWLGEGRLQAEPDHQAKRDILLSLVRNIHAYYGPHTGVRMARKHIAAQIETLQPSRETRRCILKAPSPADQLRLLEAFLDRAEIRLAA